MKAQYTGKQQFLLNHGVQMRKLGWRVGLARSNKTLLCELIGARNLYIGKDWDSLSIIMDEQLVVVDIDALTYEIPYGYDLPPTLKERSRRGTHLFYQLPKGDYACRIKRWTNVDLLVREEKDEASEYIVYNEKEDGEKTIRHPWVSHVLCSPSTNYSLVWPDALPHRNEITQAPEWLIKEVTS